MSAHSRRKQPRTKVTFRQEADKPVTLQLTRIPPEEAAAADALPLKILFKIEIEPDNPKRERVWNAFGAFLAEVLTPAESRELLRQWEEQANECASVMMSLAPFRRELVSDDSLVNIAAATEKGSF